jgi:hypothetical protein
MRLRATFLGFALAIVALVMYHAAGHGSPQQKKAEVAETPQAKNEAVVKMLKAQLQAAKKAQLAAVDKMVVKEVGGLQVLVNSNHPSAEEAYTWSVRWLHAQRDLSENKDERIAAFAEHHKRMKELQATFTTLIGDGKGGFLTPADAAVAGPAVEWYLAEAEMWLQKERGK